MKKPNLFIIGAPRSGTTSVSYYLSQHPEIYFCLGAEPLYFAEDIKDRPRVKTLKEYEALFKNAKERVVGEKSTFYMYSKKAPKAIRKYNQDAKIILILRDPAEMIESWHATLSQSRWYGDGQRINLKDRLEAAKNSRSKTFRSSDYLEMAQYEKHLKRYHTEFGKSKVLTIFLKDLKKNPQAEYDKITTFLEIKQFEPDFTPQNKGSFNSNNPVTKVNEFMKKVNPTIYKKLIEKVPLKTRFRIKQKLRKKRTKETETQEIKDLRKDLLPGIERLEKMLKVDLSEWKLRQ